MTTEKKGTHSVRLRQVDVDTTTKVGGGLGVGIRKLVDWYRYFKVMLNVCPEMPISKMDYHIIRINSMHDPLEIQEYLTAVIKKEGGDTR